MHDVDVDQEDFFAVIEDLMMRIHVFHTKFAHKRWGYSREGSTSLAKLSTPSIIAIEISQSCRVQVILKRPGLPLLEDCLLSIESIA